MNAMKTTYSNSGRLLLFALIVSMLVLNRCSDDNNGNDDNNPNDPATTTFVEGLSTPWQLAFMADGRILVTEREGRVRVIENGKLNPEPYLNLKDTIFAAGEAGLLGIAVDPDFANNPYIYIGYTYEKNKNPLVIMNKLVRYREDPATKKASFDRTLLNNIEGYINHNSGPVKFGPDGKLYWPVGERYIPDYAQNLQNLNGKILRLNRDGSIPADNPIASSYIYTYGHRNSQGIDWQPGTNNLFNTEHGPSAMQGCCLDEINLIQPGKNYGWPLIRGMQQQTGLVTPVYYSSDTATWAPAGATFITGGPWDKSFIFAGLKGESLYRAVFNANDPTKIDTVEQYFKGELGRLRTVAQGPDGKIYIATSNRDGRGVARTDDDDRILIIDPQ
jgi:glucose/arabinose dehydrogenase